MAKRRSKLPYYYQAAPSGLFTIDQLKSEGLKVKVDERPVGLLNVKGTQGGVPFESTCGVFRLDQCEPVPEPTTP